MTRIRTFAAVCALALPIPAVIAGCGGDDASSEDPQTVLDETFNNDTQVTSGDLSTDRFDVSADGDQGGSFEASLNGPFQGDPDNANAVPQLDWTASRSGSGAGQSIDFDGGLVVTDDNAYVEYKDQAYEVGTNAYNELVQQIEAQAQSERDRRSGHVPGAVLERDRAGRAATPRPATSTSRAGSPNLTQRRHRGRRRDRRSSTSPATPT